MRCWITLDLMMPEMGGYEFMVAYHKESETPVIIHRPNPDKAAALTPLRLRRCAYAAALTPLRLRRCAYAGTKKTTAATPKILAQKTRISGVRHYQ